MPRSGSFFVALCMVAIAVRHPSLPSRSARWRPVLRRRSALRCFSPWSSAIFGAQLAADKIAADLRFAELTRASADVTRDLAALAQRVERFETVALDQARSATEPIAAEIGELGALVKQFAETLQVHEAAIVQATARQHPPEAVQPPAAPAAQAALRSHSPRPRRRRLRSRCCSGRPPRSGGRLRRGCRSRPSAIFAGLARSDAIAIIDESISAKRYEIFLQPIVTLPQRKVRSYQASVRLRRRRGRCCWRRIIARSPMMPA